MMTAQPRHDFTPEQYLDFERGSSERHEYLDGDIYAMVGATKRHGKIVGNIFAQLFPELRKQNCWLYSTDMRVRPKKSKAYFYPDLVVECGEGEYEDEEEDTLLTPQLIIEVLSPSTKKFDKTEKFLRYQMIGSLEVYVTIEQSEPRIDLYNRIGNEWEHLISKDLDSIVDLPTIGCTLALADVYQGIIFDEAE
jgi:Uma2 family endonuclease